MRPTLPRQPQGPEKNSPPAIRFFHVCSVWKSRISFLPFRRAVEVFCVFQFHRVQTSSKLSMLHQIRSKTLDLPRCSSTVPRGKKRFSRIWNSVFFETKKLVLYSTNPTFSRVPEEPGCVSATFLDVFFKIYLGIWMN